MSEKGVDVGEGGEEEETVEVGVEEEEQEEQEEQDGQKGAPFGRKRRIFAPWWLSSGGGVRWR